MYRPGVDGVIPEVELDLSERASHGSSGGTWEMIDPEGHAHTLQEVREEYAHGEISDDELESETEEILRTEDED